MFAFSTAINHLSRPLRKHNYVFLNKFERSWFLICDWWISICSVCFCLSKFIACDCNKMIDTSKKQKSKLAFKFRIYVLLKSTVMKPTKIPIDSILLCDVDNHIIVEQRLMVHCAYLSGIQKSSSWKEALFKQKQE